MFPNTASTFATKAGGGGSPIATA
jgi:hypothetical protein